MTRLEKRKICVVGCGHIGRVHAGNLSPFADLHFCSRSSASAERLNAEFAGQGVFARFEDALDSSEIEAVVISTPPAFHKDQILQALAAGKAVLVEKPMCVLPEEIDAVEAALQERPDALFMVAENYYYKPSLRKIKHLLREGFIGEVSGALVKKLFTQEAAGWKSGYGALLEGGIHFVALISELFDCAPVSVSAEFPNRRSGQPERQSVTRLEYPNGARVTLGYSWEARSLTKGVLQHSYIIGSAGRIVFESNGIYVFLRGKGKTRLFFPGMVDLMGYRAMTRDFLDCLDDRTMRPYSGFDRAKRDLQIVFEAYLGL